MLLSTQSLEGTLKPEVRLVSNARLGLELERISFQIMGTSQDSQKLTKLLYSVAEAAGLLSCSKNTVYALIKSGQIVAVYPTSRTRISASSLERFVRTKEEESREMRSSQRRVER